jgi:hypothetical protein
MTQIYRLEAKVGSTDTGGIAFRFPSGKVKTLTWKTQAPIEPTLDAAKEYATKLIDEMLRGGGMDDVERTNWASAVAAIQKHILDFNQKLRVQLHREPLLIGSEKIFAASDAFAPGASAAAIDPRRIH